jgi:hypothetical protein
MGQAFNIQTGKPATREEIAAYLLSFTEVDFGEYKNYKTVELCSNGNDFIRRTFDNLIKVLRGEIEPPEPICRFPENISLPFLLSGRPVIENNN